MVVLLLFYKVHVRIFTYLEVRVNLSHYQILTRQKLQIAESTMENIDSIYYPGKGLASECINLADFIQETCKVCVILQDSCKVQKFLQHSFS